MLTVSDFEAVVSHKELFHPDFKPLKYVGVSNLIPDNLTGQPVKTLLGAVFCHLKG